MSRLSFRKSLNILLYLALSATFIFIFCELGLRYVFPDQLNTQMARPKAMNIKYYPYVTFKGIPHKESKIRKRDGSKVSYNELGYRGPIPSIEKNDEEYWIFIVGGSSVFGYSTDPASLLEQRFHEQGHSNVRVYNFGFPASKSGDDLARIAHEMTNYKPDLIIAYGGANDVEQGFYSDPRPGYPYNYLVSEANPLWDKRLRDYSIFYFVLYKSALMRRFFKDVFWKNLVHRESLRKEIDFRSSQWRISIAQTYWDNLKKSAIVSRGMKSDFLAVFQPLLFYKKDRTHKETFSDDTIAEEVREIISRIDDLSVEDPNIHFANLADFFHDHSYDVFWDSCHINPRAKVEVSHRLYELTLPYFIKKSSLLQMAQSN